MGDGEAAVPLRIGDLVDGRYRVQALLGRGGAGVVFGVEDERSGSRLAMKVHAPSGRGASAVRPAAEVEWRWRLRREFYVMTQLVHPNIVRVRDFGEAAGLPYYTMDRIEGTDSAELAPLTAAGMADLMVGLLS